MNIVYSYVSQMSDSFDHLRVAIFMFLEDVFNSQLYLKSASATHATFKALSLWLEVIVMVSRPPLTIYWRWQINLSKEALYIELGLLGTLSFIYFLRRWLQKKQFFKRLNNFIINSKRKVRYRYRSMMNNLERKSRVVALALPHLLFFGLTYLFVRLFPATANHFASDSLVYTLLPHLFHNLSHFFPFLFFSTDLFYYLKRMNLSVFLNACLIIVFGSCYIYIELAFLKNHLYKHFIAD